MILSRNINIRSLFLSPAAMLTHLANQTNSTTDKVVNVATVCICVIATMLVGYSLYVSRLCNKQKKFIEKFKKQVDIIINKQAEEGHITIDNATKEMKEIVKKQAKKMKQENEKLKFIFALTLTCVQTQNLAFFCLFISQYIPITIQSAERSATNLR